MNAKTRLGAYGLVVALGLSMAAPGAAADEERRDAQLEFWMMQRVAERLDAPLRGGYGPGEDARFVTVAEIETTRMTLDARALARQAVMLKAVRWN